MRVSSGTNKNIQLWGIIKDKTGKPIDVVTEWQGYYQAGYGDTLARAEPLWPEYVNFYQLVSFSSTGRCVGAADYREPYSLELFVEYETDGRYQYSTHNDFVIHETLFQTLNGQDVAIVR